MNLQATPNERYPASIHSIKYASIKGACAQVVSAPDSQTLWERVWRHTIDQLVLTIQMKGPNQIAAFTCTTVYAHEFGIQPWAIIQIVLAQSFSCFLSKEFIASLVAAAKTTLSRNRHFVGIKRNMPTQLPKEAMRKPYR